MTKPRYKDFREHLLKKLKNPEVALAYLNEASRDEDQRVFLLALKNVLDTHFLHTRPCHGKAIVCPSTQ